MSDRPLSIAPLSLGRQAGFSLAIALVIVAVVVGPAAPRLATLPWRPHWPELSLLAHVSPAVTLHLTTVLAAFAIGTVLMLGAKGRTLHRVLGWGFAALMMTTAVASLFIRGQNPSGFSLLHLFSGWTLVALPLALLAARKHKVRIHARAMTSLYLGGLVVAGLLTFIPGRLMWRMFFG